MSQIYLPYVSSKCTHYQISNMQRSQWPNYGQDEEDSRTI